MNEDVRRRCRDTFVFVQLIWHLLILLYMQFDSATELITIITESHPHFTETERQYSVN